MNKRDAELIGEFVYKLISAPAHTRAVMLERFVAAAEGVSGTGVCVCKSSPEERQKHAERMGFTLAAMGMNMVLDHRCPHHGEKAQPALWGRHKEKELVVTPAQWLSLGVTRP
jgi:hypothetical protein